MKDKMAAIGVNSLGFAIILLPFSVVFTEVPIQEWFVIANYLAYSLLLIFALSYLKATVTCDKIVAYSVYLDMKSKDTFFSWIPPIVVIVGSLSVYYTQGMVLLPLIIALPIITMQICRFILKYRGTK